MERYMAKKKSTKLGGNDMKSAKKHVPGKITIAAIVFDQGGVLEMYGQKLCGPSFPFAPLIR